MVSPVGRLERTDVPRRQGTVADPDGIVDAVDAAAQATVLLTAESASNIATAAAAASRTCAQAYTTGGKRNVFLKIAYKII